MSSKNDGGPAFPLQAHVDEQLSRAYLTQQGMSLRDWFAGQALSGLMASPNGPRLVKEAVDVAYCAADTMLKAREKDQAPPASGASGGSRNPHDAASPYASPVIFETNAKGPQ